MSKPITCSLKEIKTFDGNPSKRPDDKYMAEIKAYNDCALFSSEIDRPVSMENRHIRYLLLKIEKLESKIRLDNLVNQVIDESKRDDYFSHLEHKDEK